jgi:hypothetical protein
MVLVLTPSVVDRGLIPDHVKRKNIKLVFAASLHFQQISYISVLLGEVTAMPGENHRPAESH